MDIQEIRNNYFNGKISQSEVINLLITILNKSNESELRESSIKLICELNLKSIELFKLLEVCLISDKNPNVRAAAAKCMMENFLNIGLDSLKWALKHDNSVLMVKTLKNLKSILDT